MQPSSFSIGTIKLLLRLHLPADQIFVGPTFFDQVIMVAGFDHTTSLNHIDNISISDRRKPFETIRELVRKPESWYLLRR